mgnify:CR=1 FL=1
MEDILPVEGCGDCEFLTEAYESPTCCLECALEQGEQNNGS